MGRRAKNLASPFTNMKKRGMVPLLPPPASFALYKPLLSFCVHTCATISLSGLDDIIGNIKLFQRINNIR